MLIYHPAFDAYHCLFRMIALIDHLNTAEVDKVRILDFYMIFPAMIANIRMPPTQSGAKSLARKYKNEYRDPINSLSTFRDMHQIQMSALKCLAATGLIDLSKLEYGVITRTTTEIPNDLLITMQSFLNDKADISDFIINELSQFDLTGKDGLKDRTQLMEYRYDFS
ncbi:ABC-three component system middle component 5 [Providencia rettgeri]|uniref:ABC-three component system middle component 5 n=1 Tax=Providencia rettgeri TaxID=587 RepID=UPI0034E09751